MISAIVFMICRLQQGATSALSTIIRRFSTVLSFLSCRLVLPAHTQKEKGSVQIRCANRRQARLDSEGAHDRLELGPLGTLAWSRDHAMFVLMIGRTPALREPILNPRVRVMGSEPRAACESLRLLTVRLPRPSQQMVRRSGSGLKLLVSTPL